MWKILQFALMTMVSAPVAASAGASTPQQIVDRHVVEIKNGNLDGLMADYADDAVVVTPPGLMELTSPMAPGVYVGKDNVRKVFALLTDKDHIGPVRSMVSRVETRPDGVAILHWVQYSGTPKQVSGEDVFRVRNGKITFQFLTVESKQP